MMALLYHINISKKILVGILLASISFVLHAQNKTDFIQKYTFFGTYASYNYYSKGNTFYGVNDSPVNVQNINVSSYSIGGVFQVYRTKNFIFQTGFRLRHIIELRKFQIDKDQFDNPMPYYFWWTGSDFGDNILEFPIRIEYLFFHKWYLYASPVLGYHKQYEGSEDNTYGGINIYSHYYKRNDSFHFSFEAGLGIYFLTKFILIQPYVYYSKSFNNMWEGDLIIRGIKHRDYTEIHGKFNQSGNYIGIGLNLFPKKFWKKK